MKYLLPLLFLVVTIPVFAQKEFLITTSNGWKVSYNQVESNKPLPKGLQFSRWSGFSFGLGLEYKFNQNWSTHLQVKTASVEMGVTERATTLYDTTTQRFKTSYRKASHSSTSHAPAHIQLGATRYSDPIKDSKFSWLMGGGIAFLINRYANDVKTGSDSGIGPS